MKREDILCPPSSDRFIPSEIMMNNFDKNKYSASAVKHLFWFTEFRRAAVLLHQGKTLHDIKKQSEEENLFGATSRERGKMIFAAISQRLQSLPAVFLDLFCSTNIAVQKQIVLLSIMLSDHLFFDFMYEVVRGKFLIGSDELADSDYRIFFSAKQREQEQIASWKDYTLKKLSTVYRGYLLDAGVIESTSGKLKKPVVDVMLEDLLNDMKMRQYLNALTGGR